jgi:hypothetical protein
MLEQLEQEVRACVPSVVGVSLGAVLSLPVTESGGTVGAVTVYCAEVDAFDGREGALAEICGRLGPDAVRAASVSDTEWLSAALAPERDRDQNAIDWAITLVGRHLGTDTAASADQFRWAATRAGLSDSALAHAVIDLLEE